MIQYKYQAHTRRGKLVEGQIRVENEEQAMAILSGNGLTSIELKRDRLGSLLNMSIFGGGVKTKDLVLFSRQIAAMIRAGVPIVETLRAFRHQTNKVSMQSLVDTLTYDVESGDSFSRALSKHMTVFSVFFIGVVKTGEASGRLSDSLDILANYLEQNYVFSQKIRAALMYPAFVLVGVIIVSGVTFVFVLPQLVSMFDEANVDLPMPTIVLITVTTFVQHFWLLVLLLVIALVAIGRSYLKTPDGQYAASSLILRIPILSILIQKIYLARVTTILHTLFQSDVPIIQSLQIAEASIGNRVYQRVLRETVDAIKNGSSLAAAWEHQYYIPPMLTAMVGVGEKSGQVEQALSEAHRFFARDVEEVLNTVSVFVEPLLVVILAIGVGFVVAAVLLPIYNLVLVI